MSLMSRIYRLLRYSGTMPIDQKVNPVTDPGAIERTDILKHLSTIHRGQFDIRQKLEWRVIFTALTFYIVIPVGVNTYKIRLPTEWWWVLIIYSVFTLIILSFLWRIQKAHRINKCAAESAEDLLWERVGKSPADIFQRSGHPEIRSSYIFRRALPFFMAQVLMLLFFATISFFAVTFWATKQDQDSQNKAVTIEPSKPPVSQWTPVTILFERILVRWFQGKRCSRSGIGSCSLASSRESLHAARLTRGSPKTNTWLKCPRNSRRKCASSTKRRKDHVCTGKWSDHASR